MGRWVATQAAEQLIQKIADQGHANIVIATGSSQFEVLSELAKQPGIDWSKVTGFHLDEYVGLSIEHPASFCRYLKERFVNKVPLNAFHYLQGDGDIQEVISKTSELITQTKIDLALVGIGENGHLAFNDPPADFDTDAPYLVVELDEACRQQQVGEGWFATLDDVPTQAITMSIKQIMKAETIFCSVPDERKAKAVADTVQGEISSMVPASILRQHNDATLIVDETAASRLDLATRQSAEAVS
ncbi:Glucosamine-6-phosphate deaminase [Rubripirellula amarantea]|uniref:Glucosamine-6-phosphate deaminase n=2 Tax=Rubripirellula amarantea TaxID=2527999 RepID=A0A5C5WWK6_9BACT|nr:Glucosamine-6-phosphate deaminase [Rubripirellula amarantea]